MDRTTEIELVRRIFGYLDTRTTAMSDRVHLEPVTGYDCHEQAQRERRRFFRDEPFCFGPRLGFLLGALLGRFGALLGRLARLPVLPAALFRCV